ncbi:class I SAM-dependent methyltransferase [Micromonospora sp. DT4]|uniref:class I SAM-dependent methyltransferase n=1 Tax=Micromonospora sp. DT4 TaxID=3393438 RepID=UPI003CF72987
MTRTDAADGAVRPSSSATEAQPEAVRFAALRDRFGVLINIALREYLRENLDSGQRAIDLGCAGGFMCEMLATKFDEVVGIDISPDLLDIARRDRSRTNITYELTDLLLVTPETHGHFDLVYSAYTLHHVPDLDAGLRAAKQLVRPGGTLMLVHLVGRRDGRPRGWYRRQALRNLVFDVLRRRRGLTEAWELYRINTHPLWLRHIMSQRHLSAEQFEGIVKSTYPSCEVIDMGRARMVVWRRPADDTTDE